MVKYTTTHKYVTYHPQSYLHLCVHTNKHRHFQSIIQTRDIHMCIQNTQIVLHHMYYMCIHTCLRILLSLKAQPKEPVSQTPCQPSLLPSVDT